MTIETDPLMIAANNVRDAIRELTDVHGYGTSPDHPLNNQTAREIVSNILTEEFGESEGNR